MGYILNYLPAGEIHKVLMHHTYHLKQKPINFSRRKKALCYMFPILALLALLNCLPTVMYEVLRKSTLLCSLHPKFPNCSL